MTNLENELKADEIDDLDRLQHVLIAFAELMSHIPITDKGVLFEQLYNFHLELKEKKRAEFYVDFISHFCANTNVDIESEAPEFLDNVLRHLHDDNPRLIEKVIAAMNAIFKKVSKEVQFQFVPHIREAFENACTDFVGDGSPLLGYPLQHRYKKKVPFLALLGYQAGVKCLVEVV